jgi:peptidoglycan/LPS O-acetylase OafA/YrhL
MKKTPSGTDDRWAHLRACYKPGAMAHPFDSRTPAPVGLPPCLPGLDGLRGLAILMVLAHNASLLEDAKGWAKGLEAAFDLGWIGVQLFFVLSGFLITGVLRRSAATPGRWKRFLWRRGLRIFPLYFSSLLALFVVLPLFTALPAALRHDQSHQVWLWTFTANWAPQFAAVFKALPHYWSLAIEEQFYLLWPLAVWRLSRQRLLGLCMALFVLAWLVRWLMWRAHMPPDWVYESSLTRMDALVAGAALALAVESQRFLAWCRQHTRPLLVGLVGLMLLGMLASGGVFPRTTWRGQVWGFAVLSLLFTGVVLLGALSRGGWLHGGGLRALGRYSFSIYLFHKPLHDMLMAPWFLAHQPLAAASGFWALAYLAAFTALCLALGWVLYQGFERHFLALKPA